MHQAFSEMHQGKRENATCLSHSIKIVVLSQKNRQAKSLSVFLSGGGSNHNRTGQRPVREPVLTPANSLIFRAGKRWNTRAPLPREKCSRVPAGAASKRNRKVIVFSIPSFSNLFPRYNLRAVFRTQINTVVIFHLIRRSDYAASYQEASDQSRS